MSTRRKRPGRSDPQPEVLLDQEGHSIEPGPSRSQIRREASAVSDLALRLTKLPPPRRASLPLDDDLRDALELAARLTKSARARQLRLVAKMLRDLPEETRLTIEQLSSPQYRPGPTVEERLAERWRTRLLAEGDEALSEFSIEFPLADRQHLRQLLRQAKVDVPTPKSKRAGTELLRALRRALTTAPEEDGEADEGEPGSFE